MNKKCKNVIKRNLVKRYMICLFNKFFSISSIPPRKFNLTGNMTNLYPFIQGSLEVTDSCRDG